MQLPENQEKVLEFGFRPGQPGGAGRRADRRRQRRRPDPAAGRARGARRPTVLVGVLDSWAEQRKDGPGAARARRLRLDGRSRADDGTTKLDLAQQAAIGALDQFKDDDEVGLWVFSHRARAAGRPELPRAASRSRRSASSASRCRSRINARSPPTAPRCTTSRGSRTRRCWTTYDPDKINAVVLLTDGVNDDGDLERRRRPARAS